MRHDGQRQTVHIPTRISPHREPDIIRTYSPDQDPDMPPPQQPTIVPPETFSPDSDPVDPPPGGDD